MKDYKKQQKDRMKTINEKKEEERKKLDKRIDNRKVHDAKGRNEHGRRYQ